MSKIRVAVLFGGVSSEHEVSLMSASSVIRNIPREKYEVVCIGITKKGRWLYYPGSVEQIESGEWERHPDCTTAVISPDRSHRGILKLMDDGSYNLLKIDCVFPVLHGKNGEDGTIQGMLAVAGIPCVGCDTLSSADCMDKEITHILLDTAGIPTARWLAFGRPVLAAFEEAARQVEETLGYPVFVKPANAGSSVGVNKADNRAELKEAMKIAFTHDQKVLVEERIFGREVECAVLGNDSPAAALPGEITSCNEFYDYDAKYILGDSVLHIPARVTDEQAELLRQTAVKAFVRMGCSGLARVDFFVQDDGKILLNELNTIPGFTSISMYAKLWEASGIPYSELIDRLITLAIERADS